MNLVVQSLSDLAPHLPILAEMTACHGFAAVGNGCAYRLFSAMPHPDIPGYCKTHRIDWGYVAGDRKLADFRLVALDMDSTLISIECIDELADLAGLGAQVAAVTAQTMRGEIDFAESLRHRVGLLRGLDESLLQRVYDERLAFSPGAERLIGTLRQMGVKTLLASGGFTFFTERVKHALGLDYAIGNTLEIVDAKLTGRILGDILDAQGKAEHLNRFRRQLGLKREQVIAVGDGANDLAMMGEAGTSIAFRAKPIVREKVTYALDQVGLDGILHLFAVA